MDTNIVFQKTGAEIKAAVEKRREQVQQRLDRRNAALDHFMEDPRRVRSYLIRSARPPQWSHGERGYVLVSADDISSEEREEIDQLCQCIYEMEQELRRLALITAHLKDDQVFELTFNDLVGYGFD
jgi:hypothetical protein